MGVRDACSPRAAIVSVQQSLEQAKPVIDGINIVAVGALLAGWLPPLAALLTIVWTGIRIWESETVVRLRNRKRAE